MSNNTITKSKEREFQGYSYGLIAGMLIHMHMSSIPKFRAYQFVDKSSKLQIKCICYMIRIPTFTCFSLHLAQQC